MEQWQCVQKRLGNRTEKRINPQRQEPFTVGSEDTLDAALRMAAKLRPVFSLPWATHPGEARPAPWIDCADAFGRQHPRLAGRRAR
jgi:hypothetical protein